MATRGLHDFARVTIAQHLDDIALVHVLENGNLVMNRKDGVFIASQELLLEYF